MSHMNNAYPFGGKKERDQRIISHVNALYHIWIISHMNTSYHIWTIDNMKSYEPTAKLPTNFDSGFIAQMNNRLHEELWHTWMSHVSHPRQLASQRPSCPRTLTWFVYMWYDSLTRGMTHSYVTWYILVWHDSFTYAMTHSYKTRFIHVCHDSFT